MIIADRDGLTVRRFQIEIWRSMAPIFVVEADRHHTRTPLNEPVWLDPLDTPASGQHQDVIHGLPGKADFTQPAVPGTRGNTAIGEAVLKVVVFKIDSKEAEKFLIVN